MTKGMAICDDYQSHPTRVRGLKPLPDGSMESSQGVAPHAGAWIETLKATHKAKSVVGRTPRGCVD